MNTLRRLNTLLQPHRLRLVLAVACALLTCAGALAFPLAVKTLLAHREVHVPAPAWLALGAGLLLLTASSYGALVLFFEVAQRVAATLRVQCLEHLLAVPLPIQRQQQGGDLLDRLAVSIGEVESFLRNNLLDLATVGALLLGSPLVMLALSWRLTLVVALLAASTGPVLLVVSRRIRHADRARAAAAGKLTALLQEMLLGVDVVQAFTMQRAEIARFEHQQDRLRWEQRRATRFAVLLEPLLVAFAVIALVVLLVFGSRWLTAGGLNVETLIVFLAYVIIAASQGRPLGQQFLRWHQLATALHRLDEILALPRETDPPGARALPETVAGDIALTGVTYSYPGRDRALEDVSFTVTPGECVGIVGESGAGKTTLFNLLLHFIKPQAGTIQIDGIDLQQVTINSLRTAIALVPQDTYLFNVSVLENVRCGCPTATEADVRAACQGAQADAFIRALPQGYQTVVGERGLQLSAGQRQRLAIARALLKDAPILLLDEATSALDAATERELREAMATAVRGRTTLIIAHRLATVIHLSRLLVMHHGRLIDDGTHEELLDRCPVYANLVATQLLPLTHGETATTGPNKN